VHKTPVLAYSTSKGRGPVAEGWRGDGEVQKGTGSTASRRWLYSRVASKTHMQAHGWCVALTSEGDGLRGRNEANEDGGERGAVDLASLKRQKGEKNKKPTQLCTKE
jgi:hypothetical protein